VRVCGVEPGRGYGRRGGGEGRAVEVEGKRDKGPLRGMQLWARVV
jgi:hypothetical protein